MGNTQKKYMIEKNPYVHGLWKHIGLGFKYTLEQAEDAEKNNKDKDTIINQTERWVAFHNALIEQGKKAYLLSFFENKLAKGKGYQDNLKDMRDLIKKGENLEEIGKILDKIDYMLFKELGKNTTYMNGLKAVKNTYSAAISAADAYADFMTSSDNNSLGYVLDKIGDLYKVNKTLFDKLGNKRNLIAACKDYVNDMQGVSALIADDDFEKLRSLLDKIKNKKYVGSSDKLKESFRRSFHQLITYVQISEQSMASTIIEDTTEEVIEEAVNDSVKEYQSIKGQSTLPFRSYFVTKGEGRKTKSPAQAKTDKDVPINKEYFKLEVKKLQKTLIFDFKYIDLSMKFYLDTFDKETKNFTLKDISLGSSGYNIWEAFMAAKKDVNITNEAYYYLTNSLAHTISSNKYDCYYNFRDTLVKRFFLDTLVSRSKQQNEFNDYLVVNGKAYPVIGIFKDLFMSGDEGILEFSGKTSKPNLNQIRRFNGRNRLANIHFMNLKQSLEGDKMTLNGELSGLQDFKKRVVSWGIW